MCLSLVGLLVSGCGNDDDIPIPSPSGTGEEGVVEVWRTTANESLLLQEDTQELPLLEEWEADLTIELDSQTTLQVMDGFGAALTGSSAHVINTHLNNSERTSLLRSLFDPADGIGISYIRLTVGASDFSRFDYTYNDLPPGETDPQLANFDLSVEEENLIPVLQEIISIRPDIKIMATPWSPPSWMKSNDALYPGGMLLPIYEEVFAAYLVKYIQAMAGYGIPIHSITVQNEPLYAAPYPSMEMDAARQRDFIKNQLGPALHDAGLSTEILIYDHNWDNTDYPISILDDAAAKDFITGSAFHCYAGDVSAMSSVHAAHPDKGIYFTECSGGEFSPDFSNNLAWNAENLLVGATRNWAKTILLWNLALDEQNGPRNGGCQDCRGVVEINSGNGVIKRNVEYYLLGHMAKFIQPNAIRMASPNTRPQGVSQVAFQNADSSQVIVLFNHQATEMEIAVQTKQDKAFVVTMAPGSLVTCRW